MTETIIQDALKNYELSRQAMKENMDKAREDLKFVIGDQWTDQAKKDRMKNNVQTRPMFTINKIPQFTKSVINEWRQTTPGIRVHPVDSRGDVAIAKTYEGLIRNIENNSKAEIIYDDTLQQAVDGGFGYFRITSDWVDDESFDQHLLIKRIPNRFAVTLDHNAQEWNREDGQFAFVEITMSKAEFERRYPDKSTDGFWSGTANYPEWIQQDSTKIAEYFLKEPATKTMGLFSDGQARELPKKDRNLFVEDLMKNLGLTLVRERTVKTHKIKWRKITAHDILEEKDWPGLYIPIIPCWGDVTNIEGVDHVSGVVRYMKDPSRIVNYAWSTAIETMADAPKEPVLVTGEQVADHLKYWERWQTENVKFLPYTAVPGAGKPARLQSSNNAGSLLQMAAIASTELNDTTGRERASLGKPSNERSGVAITARAEQSQISTFNYSDNMNRAIAYAGQILVDMIPRIYDGSRIIRILTEKNVPVQIGINGALTQEQRDNNSKSVDLGVGKYDVMVQAGSAFATKRQEAVDTMVKLMGSDPQAAPVYRNLLLQNLDVEGAEDALAELTEEKGEPPPGAGGPTQLGPMTGGMQ